MFLTIKEVSEWLKIKPSTLYLWAAQNKIPHRRIHSLIRFDKEELTAWIESCCSKTTPNLVPSFGKPDSREIDTIIEAAKRAVYTPGHGETITPSPDRKEERHGAR
jgi:excisionase family DNA binding protein